MFTGLYEGVGGRWAIKNELQSFKLTSLNSCGWQAGVLGITSGVLLVRRPETHTQKRQCFSWSLDTEENGCFNSKQSGRRNSLLVEGRVSVSVLFRRSTDEMRPTHIGRTICFIPATDTNVKLIPKHLHINAKNNAG